MEQKFFKLTKNTTLLHCMFKTYLSYLIIQINVPDTNDDIANYIIIYEGIDVSCFTFWNTKLTCGWSLS